MISLRAQGLGKAYRLYKRPVDSLKELLFGGDRAETVWALRDVTLEVGHGEALGVIGDNGAGKSTLLRLLSGSLPPTAGRVEVSGRVSAILSLGAGFHPDLSGRENIRIGCAVLGLSPQESEALAPAIIRFSELGAFIDRPVRTYSSGMQLRLGFSVATAIEPDVLIIDEHLSVGDQHFRHKCMRRIMALRDGGSTLVFCSHDLHAIREVCQRTLWLRDGMPAMLAATADTVLAYQDHVRARDGEQALAAGAGLDPPGRAHDEATYITDVILGGDCRDGRIDHGESLEIRITAQVSQRAYGEGVHVGVLIARNDEIWCHATSTLWDEVSMPLYPVTETTYGVVYVIDELLLLGGQYTVTVALMDATSPHLYDRWTAAARFAVQQQSKDVGLIRLPHRWTRP